MVDKRNIKNIYALSPMQEGMLMHSVYGDSPLAYFEQTRYRITGQLDLEAFVSTWQEIVKRHDVFRTIFVYENVPKPIQIVLKERPIPIDSFDLKSLDLKSALQKVDDEVIKDRESPFHLTKDCLMRMKIFSCPNDIYEIIWSSHHILMDGWSLGVVLNDFFNIYAQKTGRASSPLPIPVSYGEYIKFLKIYDSKSSILFWKKYLADFSRQTRIPISFEMNELAYEPGECNFKLESKVNQDLEKIGLDKQVTIGSILQSLWSLVIWSLNDFDNDDIDVVFGVTVAGRPAEVNRVSEIVGLFINTVPARFKGSDEDSILKYILRNHNLSSSAKSHHFSSLADIQNQSNLKQKLFDHIFVFENYPLDSNEKTGESLGLTIDNFSHFDFTNYDFTFQVAPAETLEFKFLYNKNKYSEELISYLKNGLIHVINSFVANVDMPINQISLKKVPVLEDIKFKDLISYSGSSFPHQTLGMTSYLGTDLEYAISSLYYVEKGNVVNSGLLGYRKGASLIVFKDESEVILKMNELGLCDISSTHKKHIVISASFTAEPIEASINWWMTQFTIDRDVKFAPYNQVFQQLIDENSDISKNKYENIILIRLADWSRDLKEDEVDEVVASNSELFLNAVKNRVNQNNLFIYFLPFSKQSVSPANYDKFNNASFDLLGQLNEMIGVSAFDLSNIPFDYSSKEFFDQKQDEMGHIPFHEEGFECIGAAISRKLVSYFKPSFKVIVLDCDNTLWGGVVGEVGVKGVSISKGHKLFQEFIVQKYNDGFLIALCSKNNAKDVWEVFEKRPDMILKKNHISSSRINWNPKSENLKSISSDLNLGLNSFIFIDDSLMECSEVLENAPEVFTVKFPDDALNIEQFIAHNWAFDQLVVTEEDRQRNEMVQSEILRKNEKNSESSIDDFVEKLNLKIEAYELDLDTPKEIIERASQLTYRTNQFNLNTKRRSETEILELIKDPKYKVLQFQVSDRFGKYGWVGLTILEFKVDELVVDTFLLSCRVLARQVEHSILCEIINIAKAKSLKNIQLEYHKSQKNQPIFDFISKLNVDSVINNDDVQIFSLKPDINLGKVLHIEYIKLSALKTNSEKRKVEDNSYDVKEVINDLTVVDFTFEIPSNNINKCYYAAFFNNSADRIHQIKYSEIQTRNIRSKFVEAKTGDEKLMASLWSQVLNVDQIGVDDNFFELGGHSLLATRLLSLSYQNYKKELSLKDFYDNATITKMLKLLSQESITTFEIKTLEKRDLYPVSFSQKRLWALQNLDENSFAYNTPSNYIINGDLDLDAFKKAFSILVKKHESLRTNFIVIDNAPHQKIRAFSKDYFEYIQKACDDVDDFLKKEGERPFDLEKDSLIRIKVIYIRDKEYILHINMHHIISDGWSMEVIEREVIQYYQSIIRNEDVDLNPPLLQFKEFANWHNELIKNSNGKNKLRTYWLKKLSGELPKLNLPLDFDRPIIQSHRGKVCTRKLTNNFYKNISDASANLNCSKFVLLNAILKVLLYKYSGQKDVIVGIPVSGRTKSEFNDMIGFFVNTIAMRDVIDAKNNFKSFTKQVNETFTEAYDHQFYPFDLLVEDLKLDRDFSRSPIFDIFMSFQKYEENNATFDDLKIKNYNVEVEISRFDLMFHFLEGNGDIVLDITYNLDLFNVSSIDKLIDRFESLASQLLKNSHLSIQEITMISEKESFELKELGGLDSYLDQCVQNESIPSLYSSMLQMYGQNIAITEGPYELTYANLDLLSNQLANILIEHGIKKGEVVACIMPKSRYSIISLLAIVKAGAIYLPIDSKLPQNRIEYYLEDSDCKFCLVLNDLLEEHFNKDIHIINVLDSLNENISTNLALPSIDSNDLAYLIYTSGSTGKPKGTLLKHAGFVNMCLQQINIFGLKPNDSVLWFASPSFDASMSEIFMTLFSGSKLVIPLTSDIKDTDRFINLMKSKHISVVTLPPVYLHQLDISDLKDLKCMITAGEAPVHSDVQRVLNHCKYFNAYGPTEASVCASVYEIKSNEGQQKIPIGRNIPGVGVMILDADNQLVPKGQLGQIALCGIGLAHSYLNKPEITKEKFKTINWLNDRVYLTGDKGRWVNDQLVFEGRFDNQVKYRGHRIELNEINTLIKELNIAEEAETLLIGSSSDSLELVCFLMTNYDKNLIQIKSTLANHLPSYMVPNRLICLEAFPLNHNGKIDKVQLNEIYTNTKEKTIKTLPETEQQKDIYSALAQILKGHNFDIDDNIFDLGADSIRIIELVSRLRKLGYVLKTQIVFKYPTIRQLSEQIGSKKVNSVELSNLFEGELLLSPIQKWYFETFSGHSHHFNHSEVYQCFKPMDVELLQKTVESLAFSHDLLRAQVNDGVMKISSEIGNVFKVVNVSESDVNNLINKEQTDISNLNGSLWRVVLFKSDSVERILFCFHHLIIDGVSWRLLIEDFLSTYSDLESGNYTLRKYDGFQEWTKLVHTFSQSKEILKEVDYWNSFSGDSSIDFPQDHKLKDLSFDRIDAVGVEFDEEETQFLVTATLTKFNCNINELLLAALAIALGSIKDCKNTTIMMEGHGRDEDIAKDLNISQMVGWFTNAFPFKLIHSEGDFANQISTIKESYKNLPREGLGYSILKYISPKYLGREVLKTVSPKISFNYLGRYEGFGVNEYLQEDSSLKDFSVGPKTPLLYCLNINGIIHKNKLQFYFSYHKGMYDRSFVDKIAQSFKCSLSSIFASLSIK